MNLLAPLQQEKNVPTSERIFLTTCKSEESDDFGIVEVR
jgi:hypothetical protein